jgi:hypothetical protein
LTARSILMRFFPKVKMTRCNTCGQIYVTDWFSLLQMCANSLPFALQPSARGRQWRFSSVQPQKSVSILSLACKTLSPTTHLAIFQRTSLFWVVRGVAHDVGAAMCYWILAIDSEPSCVNHHQGL